MKAYHFLKGDMTTGYGAEAPWTVGEKRTVQGSIGLCVWGYHSATSWLDALVYAPGPMACIVDVSWPIDSDGFKHVSSSRKLLAARDVSQEVHLFAGECIERAERILESWGNRANVDCRKVLITRKTALIDEQPPEWHKLVGTIFWTGNVAVRGERSWQKQRLDEILNTLFSDVSLIHEGK